MRLGATVMRLAVSAGATIALAVATVVWSEWWFWSRVRPEDSVLGSVQTVLFYAAAVQVCRLVAHRARVTGGGSFAWRGVFLIGLLFGWLVEGVIVTTVVEDLPGSIAWTGMAWHALFTVLLGWWLAPRLLARALRTSLPLLATIGIGAGVWAAFWRFEEGVVIEPLEFAGYVFVTTFAYALGLAGWWALRRRADPGVPGSLPAIVFLAGLAVLNAMAAPITLIGPALALLAILAVVLVRNRDSPAGFLTNEPTPWASLWRLVVIPVAAAMVYAVFAAQPSPVPTGWAFYVLGVLVSVVLTIGALRPASRGAWFRGRRAKQRT